jgi:hypothetical protein
VSSFRFRIERVRALSGLVLGLASSGCSFIFVTPPPSQVEQPVPHPNTDCTSGRAAPIIDGLITGYELVRTGYAASGGGDYAGAPINRQTDALLGAAFAALFLASTIYGTVNTSSCKRLKEGPGPDEVVPGIDHDLPPEPPAAPAQAPSTAPTPAPTVPPGSAAFPVP